MIVVDASVWVTALVDADLPGDASRLALSSDPEWVAPSHAPIEALRTIRRYEYAGLVTAEQADHHAAAVRAAEVRYTGPEAWLLERVWDQRHNISPYDAPYVVLALRYRIPLVTLDQRLARAAETAGAEVFVPG